MSSLGIQPLQPVDATEQRRVCLITRVLTCLAGFNCAFQITWFWRLTNHNINYDAISYIGIARHIIDGDFSSSLNGYWSPLVSWCIASMAHFSGNLTLLGRLVTIGSFLLCLPILYVLTYHLWRSPLLAAMSVLWFTTARGVAAFSVYFVGADFLFTALVLLHFVLLLRCLRDPSVGRWILLGLPHGIAFLAKAVAMPWLAISTVLASLLVGRFNPRRAPLYLCAGLAIPILVWFSWGMILKTRYGVFTAGYQSKWNLLDQSTRGEAERSGSNMLVLRDTTRSSDSYMVVDNMFPGSALWRTQLEWAKAIRLIVAKERQNLPKALKELLILLTPGGGLAIILTLVALAGQRQHPQTQFILIVFVQTASLIGLYCMLVFDTRYVIPLAPLLMAVTVPFVVPGRKPQFSSAQFPQARAVAAGLLVLGTVFFQAYWASPFRTLRRDYQLSCYDAARKLHTIPHCNKLVVVGPGPYQEHGVGWEAGLYASYFAQCRMVAFTSDIPTLGQAQQMQNDLLKIEPDAILLFGTNGNAVYESALTTIQGSQPGLRSEHIVDSQAGEVGKLWLRSDR